MSTNPLVITLVQISSPEHYSLWNALSIETLSGHIRAIFGKEIHVNLLKIQHNKDVKSFIEGIKICPPRIIGISPELGSIEWTTEICDQLHQIEFPNSEKPKLIFGNKLPTFFPRFFLDLCPEAIVVIGEGEKSFEGIIEHYLYKKPLSSVPNLYFNNNTNMLVVTEEKNPDLKDLIYPPSTDTIDEMVKLGGNALVQASRGCPWSRCTYCTISSFRKGKGWQGFPIQRIAANIKEIALKGIKEIEFADDEFLGGREESHILRGLAFADCIEQIRKDTGVDLTFRIFLIPHTIYRDGDEERNWEIKKLLLRLKEVGLSKIYIGAESGCSSQLKRYGRGYTSELLQQVILFLKYEIDIPIDVGFVMFDPKLSPEELLQNIIFYRKNNLIKSNQWPFRPLILNVGSKLMNKINKNYVQGDPDINYMKYNYKFENPLIESIFNTVDLLSKESRSIFYSLKVISKRQHNIRKQDQETIRSLMYIEKNAEIYLDVMESLVYCYNNESSKTKDEIVEDARMQVNNIIELVNVDIAKNIISDPKMFITDKIAQYKKASRNRKG